MVSLVAAVCRSPFVWLGFTLSVFSFAFLWNLSGVVDLVLIFCWGGAVMLFCLAGGLGLFCCGVRA